MKNFKCLIQSVTAGLILVAGHAVGAGSLPLLSETNHHLLTLQDSAGTIVVDSRGVQTAHMTVIDWLTFSGPACSPDDYIADGSNTAASFTLRPGTYSILAKALYATFLLNNAMDSVSVATVQSFKLTFSDTDGSLLSPIYSCFNATCDTDPEVEECTGGDTKTVSLTSHVI